MPFGEVKLIPGVNVERTSTLNEAGYSQSQLIRFKDGLAQKYGGWQKFFAFALSGVPRDLHAWEDLNQVTHLAVGTTTRLNVITGGSLKDITPQTFASDFAPNFTTTAGSPLVQITDPNIANVTTFDSVLFNTPIAIDGLILSGSYPIAVITGVTSYKITATANAVAGVTGGGAVPTFTTSNGSAVVQVNLAAHGLTVGVGFAHQINFPIATTGNGVTIVGSYTVTSVVGVNAFNIAANTQANASSTFSMNAGNTELVYYINVGPPATGTGYGLGPYGAGGYGTGAAAASTQTGTEITATDYTQDNWGAILLSCPANGGIYQFDPTGGFTNAGLVATAPVFNGGMLVSMSLQILMCWATTQTLGIGIQQDPMLIKWSDQGDFTDFVPLPTNQAGSFRIPIGSTLRGALAVSNQTLFWTDLDLWAANYLGPPLVFGFNKIGAGAGLISSHAAQALRGQVLWMGASNFYRYDGGGARVLPCPVWDFVFQNLNTAFQSNVRAMPNTPFNEAGWEFPSLASSNGECDSYVKFNITEPGGPWDFGALPRSAWMDQTILGPPIGATPTGLIYQHETTNDADGNTLFAGFITGYFYIAEGEDFAFVDRIYPDFKFGTFAGPSSAQITIVVFAVNFPGDVPTSYGPFTVTQSTQEISVRIRARQMAFQILSADIGSFWRLGKVRYRYAPDGRR